LPIVWQTALELPRFEVPKGARVFAWERWSRAPVICGFKRGSGAVLWVITSPGERGYERFPYIAHALADLGVDPPFRSTRLWAFFDYSYRMRVDLDYFAARWRAAGISALHVAAWHFYDAAPERDQYLRSLIEACHRKGILVYAWLELPHVSEKFWNDHPEWREKTAVLQDAHLDWRKLMNLANRDCFQAVSAGVRDLVGRFEWDGVNLAELYFESLEGAGNPSRFTPMNDDVRAEFRALRGFDPIELFQNRKDAESLRLFLDYRAGLARRIQKEWMEEVAKARGARPDLDLVLTHVDDRFDQGMREAIGADAAQVLPLAGERNFTFLIEDPATVWHLGPARYQEIARRYKPITPSPGKLAIDLNIVERYQDVYPTKQQTGTELFQLVHLASAAFPRVALYFENSILRPDLKLLPAAGAVVSRFERVGTKLVVESPSGVGVAWSGPALVDGEAWPVASDSVLWLPAGGHSVERGSGTGHFSRVLDFNGELKGARVLVGGAVEIAYQSVSRAFAVLERKPVKVEIDGAATRMKLAGDRTLVLPRGQHLVTIQTE
ncbi:MAG: hypothetical protein M1541_13105, partial [Acidobacteria bacterium]|nr:hypothetical protein [Acidobacteriota bacterium]